MSFRVITIVFLLLSANQAFAQGERSQLQSVHYEMDISLQADRHQMEGRQRLTYRNDSPDALREVYYHLYFNAFNPNSMMAERNRNLPDPDPRVVPRIFNLGPDEIGYHRIGSLTYNGRPVPFEINDTVMKVRLDEPLMPGAEAVFDMTFTSQVPLQTRRSGRDSREGIDYSMSQWYPKMAAYDETGWHADPYIGREFYAPFGTFDVQITLPSDYVIGATGVLQNPGEVGHGYAPESTAAQAGDSLTWHFMAENVHDFAWAADPDYIHDVIQDGDLGITYHLLYQPDVAAQWQILHERLPLLFQSFEAQVGPYQWPQFSVVQGGDGGMEYPMLTLITGRRSPGSVLGVTAHEAAHMWFYGMLASNEAAYAWMDEGFADYISEEAMAFAMGQERPNHAGSLLSMVSAKERGFFEAPATRSDWFMSNSAYSVGSYSTGEALATTMGYLISPALRDAWLQAYYQRFQFRHPDPADVQKVAEDISGLRLDWYFDQFLNHTYPLDLAVEDLDTRRSPGGMWRTEVVLERETDYAMPVDLAVRLEDGTYHWVNIPLSEMLGHKPVPADWTVAEPWAWTSPRYTLSVDLPSRPVEAIIDPLFQTADQNRLNNTSKFPMEARFFRAPEPTWSSYSVGYRPLAQYAQDFGFAAGVQVRGAYIFNQHELKAMVKLWPQVLLTGGDEPGVNPYEDFSSPGFPLPEFSGTAWDGIDYELDYSREIPGFGPFVRGNVSLQKHLGVLQNSLSASKTLGRFPLFADVDREVTFGVLHQYRPSNRSFTVYPLLQFSDRHVVSAFGRFRMSEGNDFLSVLAETGAAVGDDGFPGSAHRVMLDASKHQGIGFLTGGAHLRLGVGANDLAPQKRFRLGAATLEEAWQNDAFRSVSAALEGASLTPPFDRDIPFGALSNAGPSAYSLGIVPTGTRIVAGGLTLQTGSLVENAWLNPLRLEAFSGAGRVWNGDGFLEIEGIGDFQVDAGLGVIYDFPALERLSFLTEQSDVLSTLRLHVRFPFWVADPLLVGDTDEFGFRWLVGIEVF